MEQVASYRYLLGDTFKGTEAHVTLWSCHLQRAYPAHILLRFCGFALKVR